jgi:demethylmenaquinone methyltransferase/2-methoxy-6-polyprenyl-1,4-benzoquinol methylase
MLENNGLKNSIPSDPSPHRNEETFSFRTILIREKAAYVLRHFTSIAGKYDFMNTVLSFGIHHLWKRRAVDSLHLKPGSLAIDVCGGTADLAILASRAMSPGGRVVVYDINRAMMEGGRPKAQRASLEGSIRFVQGDAETISFPEGRFDAAMIGFGIRNVTDMARALAEIHRVLRSGSRFMCLEFSLPVFPWFRNLYAFYSFRIMPLLGKLLAGNREAYLYLPETIRKFPPPDEFAALLRKTGFAGVAYERLTNGIAVIYTGVKA